MLLKKVTSLLLAMAMVLAFAACGGSNYSDSNYGGDYNDINSGNNGGSSNSGSSNGGSSNSGSSNGGSSNGGSSNGGSSNVIKDDELVAKNGEELAYVMIYNPDIFDENSYFNESLSTGYLGRQVDTDASRADGLDEEEILYTYLTQQDIYGNINFEDYIPEENKANGLSPIYDEGDTKDFYAFATRISNQRDLVEFTCVYAGEHCNVWGYGYYDEDDLISYGEEFDDNIYEEELEYFGEPRFNDKNAKVNLLFYEFPVMGYLGVCYYFDTFAEGELDSDDEDAFTPNYGHNIVHINSAINDEDIVYSTMAHEYQHMLAYGAAFNTVKQVFCRTWLNEAMSGFIEERLYPGGKESPSVGHINEFLRGTQVKYGQSMYNFATTKDIGVYGSVWFFSEYMAELAGDEVFSNIHEYWNESYSRTLDEAEALYNSVSKSVRTKIDNSISYPSGLDFNTDEQEWMSKLIFNFYLTMFTQEGDVPDEFEEHIKQNRLLYDQRNETNIEGGGRIFLAVSDGEFEIPDDADEGLIYVGFNSDFEIVTDYIYN